MIQHFKHFFYFEHWNVYRHIKCFRLEYRIENERFLGISKQKNAYFSGITGRNGRFLGLSNGLTEKWPIFLVIFHRRSNFL